MPLIWMSGPAEAVEQDSYTNGPAPWFSFCPDFGDIIVGKNLKGITVICETWEGNPYPIPAAHQRKGNHIMTRKITYIVTLPDGRTATRKSHRLYTFALIGRRRQYTVDLKEGPNLVPKGYGDFEVLSYAATEPLAHARINQFSAIDKRVVPVRTKSASLGE